MASHACRCPPLRALQHPDGGGCRRRDSRRAASTGGGRRRVVQLVLQAQQRLASLQGEALLAYALGTLALHLLLARFVGRWFAFGVSLLIGAGLAWWLIVASGPLSGWGGLGIIIVALGLAGSGLLLAPLLDALYTRYFRRR
jgi:hypothetical protein